MTIRPLSSHSSPALLPGRGLLALGALSLLCAACAAAPPPALSRPAAPAALSVGVRVEQEIGGAEVREHRIDLPAGSYARVTVEQAAIDVALELRGPDGAEVARVNSPGGHRMPELVSWVAPAAGPYRLLVSAEDPQAPRDAYAVTLEEVRPAVAGDAALVATESAASAARQQSFSERAEDRREALKDLQQVLAAWQAAGDHVREARTLNDIGDLQVRLGDQEAALSILARALDLARGCGDRREQARALTQLGVASRKMGKETTEVADLYRQSLELWREVKDPAGEGEVLFSMGVLHANEGDSATAVTYYEQALDLQQKAGAIGDEAFTLAALGLIAHNRGDMSRALDGFNRGLDLARRSGDRPAEAYLLDLTAAVYLRRGELQRAVELDTTALGLYRVQGNRTQEASILTNLGSAYAYLGDLDRALDCYRTALEIQRAAQDRRLQLFPLLFLGRVLQLRGDTEGAVARYTEASDIARALDYGPGLAQSLYFLGRADLALGQTADGVRWLEEALSLNEKMGDALNKAQVLLELGRAAHVRGDDEMAAGQFRQALDLGRSLQYFVVEAAAQGGIARLERDRGNLAAARTAVEEALRVLESVRSKVASQRLRVSFVASQKAYYGLHLDILMRLHEKDPGGGYLAASLAASERARARGLLDLLAEGRIDVRQGIAADLKQSEEEIDDRISGLQSQMLSDLSAGVWNAAKAAEMEKKTQQAQEDREKLEWEIRSRHPHYAAVRYPEPLRLEEIQALLDNRTAFLEYAVGEERSFLFVVTREGLTSYVLPPSARLADEVRQVRTGLEKTGRRNYGLYVETAVRLHQELIAPAAGVLAQKPHLIVAPDGPLHFLSFEALLTADPGVRDQGFDGLPYLIRDRSVTYVPSASVLAELARPREPVQQTAAASAPRFIGFADPVPAVPAASAAAAAPAALRDGSLASLLPGLGRLAESRQEVSEIAGLYKPGEARLYLDREATEENVKENDLLRTARRIHFATHGLLDEKQPELSGLVLSRASGSREDGLLQVYEIFNLQLDADLVVLSACNSGLGTMVSGEGLVGVTRALLYAGAHSVVVSLWQVDDASTPDLMVSFYRHLDRDGDKAESLRQAKLEMISGKRFAHPFYWAPFILIGESNEKQPSGVTSSEPARL